MAKFFCNYCGSGYDSVGALTNGTCTKNPNGKNHVPYEGGIKSRYVCKYCGSGYSSIGSLTNGTCNKNPNSKSHVPMI